MSWFHKFCRDVGLMVHNIRRPDHERNVTRQETREQKRGGITLRRTTIEEIEVDTKDSSKPGA
jgi:hypothetical protein